MGEHLPVLLKEVSEYLDIQNNDIVLDATLGERGHSTMIAEQLGEDGVLIGIDTDITSIENARSNEILGHTKCKKHFIQSNFRNLDNVLRELGVKEVNKILFDLGWSMDQFRDTNRGFSFQIDGPLDMRLGDDASFTASDIVNSWEEESIVDILTGYGEERYARGIAEEIIKARSEKPIKTTLELVEIIKSGTPPRYHRGRIHPATRTFQALRMAVNDEIGALKEGITKGFGALAKDGIMVVISFHSIEDRIVKRFYREQVKNNLAKLLNKRPMIPSEEEVMKNKRARSAKLRAIMKI